MVLTRLDVAYRRQTRQLRENIRQYTTSSWDRLGSWRDADYARFSDVVVPRIESAQQRMAVLTDSYIRQSANHAFGSISAASSVDVSTLSLRGVPVEEVYRRPFVDAYTALSESQSMPAALAAGRARLDDLVTSGMQLARTHSARASMQQSRFLGYQRVPRGTQSCALCLIASTQRYHVGDLLPIHPGCQCLVKPLRGAIDQLVINEDLLDRVHDEIAAHLGRSELSARDLGLGKTDAKGRELSDYTDLMVVNMHSELGPMLSWRDHTFTSETDIAALAR